MPVESANKVRTQLRKRVTNKDELIKYLNSHPDSELPFVEVCWNDAVRKCKENEGKGDKVTYKTVIDADGIPHEKQQSRTRYIVDPCRMYFKLMSLKIYSNVGLQIQKENQVKYENEREVFKIYKNKEQEYTLDNDEILSWIEMLPPDEKEYISRRYSRYYDTYDINDGADRATLKRLLSIELEAFRIDIARALGKKSNINDEKKVNEMMQDTMESLKWTKKQRSAREDMAKNRFTVWMDGMAVDGKFKVEEKTYPKDEIDYILDKIMENTRKVIS